MLLWVSNVYIIPFSWTECYLDMKIDIQIRIVITQHREVFSSLHWWGVFLLTLVIDIYLIYSYKIACLHPIPLSYINYVDTQIYINPFDIRNISILVVSDRIVIKQLEYMPYHIMRLLKAILSRLYFHLLSNHWTVRVSPPYNVNSLIWPECLSSCAAEKPVHV